MRELFLTPAMAREIMAWGVFFRLAARMARDHPVFCLPARRAQNHLYDKRH